MHASRNGQRNRRDEMRNLIPLTDEQIESRFAGNPIEDLTFTRETIADFKSARAGYVNAGRVVKDDADELVIDGVQLRRGESRHELTVVDFGEVRAVFHA